MVNLRASKRLWREELIGTPAQSYAICDPVAPFDRGRQSLIQIQGKATRNSLANYRLPDPCIKPWVDNFIHPANAQTIPPHTDITLCASLGDSDTMSIC